MTLLDSIRRALGQTESKPSAAIPSRAQTPAEIRVPEVSPAQLMAELRDGREHRPLLLDCREYFERRQVYVPGSLHIPMNQIPERLGELDRLHEVVVICAHGNRSYGVAGWLRQQGFEARSLSGGTVGWQHAGGPIEDPRRPA
jgi:rhodanese-related sulfurtransferase